MDFSKLKSIKGYEETKISPPGLKYSSGSSLSSITCFKIETDLERLINLVENDNSDSSNDPLLEEVNLFLSDNLIPPGIENVADNPEGDIRFLEELLIDDSILSHESSDSSFEDNTSISRPPLEPPDDNFDLEPE
nr:hypothetical protein [Tanacetum cinerariifolium]